MEIVNKKIEDYISNLTSHLCLELEELERETYASIPMPNMLSGKEQGMFLYQFVSALNPKLVLELGTYTGYSAICMALGMSDDSKLVTLDVNEEIAHLPRKYFEKLNLQNKIDFKITKALDYIETIDDDSLDLVFIDADKSNYPNYFRNLKSKVRSGGFILVDNILWHGDVLNEKPDNRTKAILETTKLMFQDNNFLCSILPLRDGILVGKKK
jgi:caffeoyl-CoA O-methyltransferase